MVKGFSPDSRSCSKGYSFHLFSVKDLTMLNMFNTLKCYLLPCCLPQHSLACLFLMKQFCVRINFDMLVGYLPLSHRKAQVALLPCGLHMEREEGEKLHELKNPGE